MFDLSVPVIECDGIVHWKLMLSSTYQVSYLRLCIDGVEGEVDIADLICRQPVVALRCHQQNFYHLPFLHIYIDIFEPSILSTVLNLSIVC